MSAFCSMQPWNLVGSAKLGRHQQEAPMSVNPLMSEPVEDLASRLEAMTDDELFETMNELEKVSDRAEHDATEEALSRIALTESEIERRYPGRLLAPYRDWRQRQPLL